VLLAMLVMVAERPIVPGKPLVSIGVFGVVVVSKL
jgi:hypothetical protein